MDKSKAPVAAMTMVHTEDFFLERWLAHWRKILPDAHIYVINHGGDKDVARLAKGCNIINLPYDETKKSVNQRRWQILSLHSSAMTAFYNWVVVGDVDEFVVLDPAVSNDVVEYLMALSHTKSPPPAITTFAIEMVHVPHLEPQKIVPGEPIIGPRRIYRLNSNYCKPCIIRQPTEFKAGGHGANHAKVFIDPNLYNFHLRFVDYEYCMGRFRKSLERRLKGKTKEEQAAMKDGNWGWSYVDQTFDAISKREPQAETIDHPEFRKNMLDKAIQRPPFTLMGGGRPAQNFRLPSRFDGVF